MSYNWNTQFFDPKNIIEISRGDPNQVLKYLNQFQKLMPERISSLQDVLKKGDRKQVRQILHSMSPQLKFFRVPNITIPIQRLELEYETMDKLELETMVESILLTLNKATEEVNRVISTNFG